MVQGMDSVYISPMAATFQNASICRRTTLTLAWFLVALAFSPAQAQDGPPPWPPFEKYAPQIGEPFPDITIHDDLGNPVNLRELANENYKVLVLGCLT